jgi:hypothetical protein
VEAGDGIASGSLKETQFTIVPISAVVMLVIVVSATGMLELMLVFVLEPCIAAVLKHAILTMTVDTTLLASSIPAVDNKESVLQFATLNQPIC